MYLENRSGDDQYVVVIDDNVSNNLKGQQNVSSADEVDNNMEPLASYMEPLASYMEPLACYMEPLASYMEAVSYDNNSETMVMTLAYAFGGRIML